MSQSEELERQLSELLTEGELKANDLKKREDVSPKYEVRIQTELDPIVEETRHYRSIAKEVDHRYDSYMDRAERHKKPKSEK